MRPQGQGGDQAGGLEDSPDGPGEPHWMGAVSGRGTTVISTSRPHEGGGGSHCEASPGGAQRAAGGAEAGDKPGREGIAQISGPSTTATSGPLWPSSSPHKVIL